MPQQGQAWTFDEMKAFEVALARHLHEGGEEDRLVYIQSQALPSKSLSDIKRAFEQLEMDLQAIHNSRDIAELDPSYGTTTSSGSDPAKKKCKTGSGGDDRRKGIAWTEEEHRLFLAGLDKFGKGSWRSIARQYVITRTPTQVASHAQKYFLRLNAVRGEKKEKRRASIHDIRTNNAAKGQQWGSADFGPHPVMTVYGECQ